MNHDIILKKALPNQKTVVILGNARSGTSLISGILTKMGISMDSQYGKPDKYAPKGYYESQEAHSINTQIFQLAWDNKVQFDLDAHFYPPPYEKILQQADAVKKDIITFINNFSNCNIWGFKNPKTSLTADLFLPYLNNPHFIILLRNPVSNAKAINKIYRIPFLKAMEITSYYNFIISKICVKHNIPKLFINFEQMRIEPNVIVKEILRFLDLNISEEIMRDVNSVIVPGYSTTSNDSTFSTQ